MFRKLVSHLPYSPALIEDIGFYAHRLRQEDATRRTTLIFATLALIIQSLTVFSPPEAANASSEQDIVRGGVSSLEDFLLRYDRNEEDLKDIYSSIGVTRSEIASATQGTIATRSNTYIMNRYGQLTSSQKEVSMSYQRSSGGVGVRYFSPLSSLTSTRTTFDGWIGNSTSLGWFGIIKSSGSIATQGIPSTINPLGNKDTSASRTISVKNLSQSREDHFTAKEADKLAYTLKQANTTNEVTSAPFTVRLADILEYATISDSGGGVFDNKTKTLSWPEVQLQPNESQTRSFVIQLLSELPATGIGKSNPTSYDCKLTVSFGNVLTHPINCPFAKSVEGVFALLPKTGIGINIGFAILLLSVIIFFYLRTRQLKTEIRIIRHNFNSGVI